MRNYYLRKSLKCFVIIAGLNFAIPQAVSEEYDSQYPITFGVNNIFDIASNVSGGNQRDTVVLYNMDITAKFDAEYFGLQDGTFYIYGLINNAKELNPIVGDLQVTSNIDNGEVFRIYEFWYEQLFSEGNASLKFGLYDLNSEFDAIETSGLFLNSSHGIGPDFSQSGENGPSIFPSTSLALRLQYQISDGLTVRAAILDAVPNDPNNPKKQKISLHEGALLVGETEVSFADGWRLVVGLWHYTKKFSPLDETSPQPIGGNTGYYSFVEGPLSEKISTWFRIGKANQEINQISYYIGSGVVLRGILSSRPDDELGFAFAMANNGSVYKNLRMKALTPVDDYEISYEVTYRFQVAPWLVLQPDVQYIKNPGTNKALKDALVVGLRIEIGDFF